MLQIMSSNLRDEGLLFALLYIVKMNREKKKVYHIEILF